MAEANTEEPKPSSNRVEALKLQAQARKRQLELMQQGENVNATSVPQEFTFTEKSIGEAEVLGTLLSGTVGSVASAANFYLDFLKGVKEGDTYYQMLTRVNKGIENTTANFTYQPRTESGQQSLQTMAGAAEKIGGFLDMIGDGVAAATGSPVAGALAQTGVEAAPMALGIRPTHNWVKRYKDVKKVEKVAEGMGIDLDANTAKQLEQLEQYALSVAPSDITSLQELSKRLVEARTISQVYRDQLHKSAHAVSAGNEILIPSQPAAGASRNAFRLFDESINKQIEVTGYPIKDMPLARSALSEFRQIVSRRQNDIIKLNDIVKYKRANSSRMKKLDPIDDERKALSLINSELTDYLDELYDANMMSGDPRAINLWRMANRAAKEHIDTFNADKTIKRMTMNEATPEQLKSWLYGASASGAKPKAAEMIARVKTIVGDSGLEPVRVVARFDLLRPLLKHNPNYSQFVDNFDTFLSQKPTVARELFGEKGLSDIKQLRTMASQLDKAKGSTKGLLLDFDSLLARVTIGHQIARAGARVTLASSVLRALRGQADDTGKMRVVSAFSGYDVTKPMFSGRILPLLGAEEAFLQSRERLTPPGALPDAVRTGAQQ